MGVGSQRTYGVTDPISTAPPSPLDHRLTLELEECLHKNKLFLTKEMVQKRERVLLELQSIIRDWVFRVCIAQGMTEEMAQDHGARIYTYGSWRLGVSSPGADIDTLCVAPRNVDRSRDVFGMPDPSTQAVPKEENVLLHILRKRPEVSNLVPVPDSFVPVVKFAFDGVEIDLICACLQMTTIPAKLDIGDDKVLRNLQESTQRSVNGVRVTDMILKLVPNITTFRTTLRAIKLWAESRGIYSAKLGYFGGVQCGILTARICQLYPNAVPSFLVSRFFRVYAEWKWPTPVLLAPISQGNPNLGYAVWNPYGVNSRELMPVITPAYPSMNSMFNVTVSTLNVFKKEIARGKEIVEKIYKRAETASQNGSAPSAGSDTSEWNALFAKSEFFSDYKNLLQIDVYAESPSSLEKWSGWVNSRLRHLIQHLEISPDIAQVRPYPKGFEGNPGKLKNCCTTYFFGLKFDIVKDGGRKQVDIGRPVQDWRINKVEMFRDRTPGMGLDMSHVKNTNLPEFVKSQIPPIVKRKKKKKKKKKVATSGPVENGTDDKQQNGDGATGKRERSNDSGKAVEEGEDGAKRRRVSEEAAGTGEGTDRRVNDAEKLIDGTKQGPFVKEANAGESEKVASE